MEENKTAPEKETHSTADTAKDMGKSAFAAVEKEVKVLEEKIMHLPVDRRMIVFVGVIVLIAAFLGDFGTVVLALIAVGMIYIGFSGNNFAAKFLKAKPEEKKK